MQQIEVDIACPYCGEPLTVLVDGSQEEQQYYEDCQVCCQPMLMDVRCSYDGELISLSAEQD